MDTLLAIYSVHTVVPCTVRSAYLDCKNQIYSFSAVWGGLLRSPAEMRSTGVRAHSGPATHPPERSRRVVCLRNVSSQSPHKPYVGQASGIFYHSADDITR